MAEQKPGGGVPGHNHEAPATSAYAALTSTDRGHVSMQER